MFQNTLLKTLINCFVVQKELRPSYVCKKLNEDVDNPERVILSLAEKTGATLQPMFACGMAFNAEQYLILLGEKTCIEFLKCKKWRVFNRV